MGTAPYLIFIVQFKISSKMKTLLISLIMFLSASVFGNCEDCRERIENAADIKGVKVVKWDPETKIATATFDKEKVTLLKIQEAIAASGYDAGKVKGNSKAYGKLPKCCKYRDNKCEE
jgi:periplasmic mercuric ion binding protein